MDGLFRDNAGERRRFLDRLVLAVDPNHGARVNQLERALRGRNRLLEEGARDLQWLEAIEREAAELAVAVAAARSECVTRLNALIAQGAQNGVPSSTISPYIERWGTSSANADSSDLSQSFNV